MIELDTKAELDLLTTFKADLSNSDPFKDEWDTKRGVYKDEWAGKLYGNEVKGKSQVVSRDIKSAQTWQHSVIKDPFVNSQDGVKATPVGAEDTPLTEQTASVLNYQYSRDFKRYNFVSSTLKVLQIEGTVVARVYWEFEEKEVEVEEPVFEMVPIRTPQGWQYQQQQTGVQMVTKTVTVVNRPNARLVKNTDLWADPTEKENIENAQFVIERWKSNKSELSQDPKYSNLDGIAPADNPSTSDDDDIYDDDIDTSFTFQDDPRKELEVYEYWGNYDLDEDGIAEPIVCAWVGNTIIRLEESPYSDGKVPFISCAYDPEPFSINGEANAEIVSTNQKLRTAIKRSFIDTLDKSTNGQRGFQQGTLDPVNAKRFKNGKDFEFQGQNPNFWEGKYNDFNSSVMNFYGMVGAEIESDTGVRAFNQGQQQGTSAKQVGASMDATGKREVDISRNYAENFIGPILKKWNSMNADFLEPEDVERITNKPYVKPDPMDPDGNLDIRIQVNTAEADAEKAKELAFMLQTNGPNDDPRITQKIKSELFKLRGMPELAKWMEDYQPQPDPFEQEMKKLEVQLKIAEIQERNSRAQENAIDMKLKEAKTITEQAKARQTHSDADGKDLDYVRKSNGQDKQDEIDKENVKTRNKMIEEDNKPKGTSNA